MTMRETLGLGGSDPDDLAAVVCAAMRMAGRCPVASFVFEDGKAVAIEVHDEGRLAARFPMFPLEMSENLAWLLSRQIAPQEPLTISKSTK